MISVWFCQTISRKDCAPPPFPYRYILCMVCFVLSLSAFVCGQFDTIECAASASHRGKISFNKKIKQKQKMYSGLIFTKSKPNSGIGGFAFTLSCFCRNCTRLGSNNPVAWWCSIYMIGSFEACSVWRLLVQISPCACFLPTLVAESTSCEQAEFDENRWVKRGLNPTNQRATKFQGVYRTVNRRKYVCA